MPTPFHLATPRLLLRPWRTSDRAPFAAMNADPTVMRFFAAPLTPAQSDADIDRYLLQLHCDGFTMLASEFTHTGAFLGTIGMQIMRDHVPNLPNTPENPAIEIGWRLTADAQGRGLATEGARAIVHHAFHTLHLPTLVAVTVPANTASRRVMEKLGMTPRPELTFNHPRVPAGHPNQQHILYRLTNPHFRPPA